MGECAYGRCAYGGWGNVCMRECTYGGNVCMGVCVWGNVCMGKCMGNVCMGKYKHENINHYIMGE